MSMCPAGTRLIFRGPPEQALPTCPQNGVTHGHRHVPRRDELCRLPYGPPASNSMSPYPTNLNAASGSAMVFTSLDVHRTSVQCGGGVRTRQAYAAIGRAYCTLSKPTLPEVGSDRSAGSGPASNSGSIVITHLHVGPSRPTAVYPPSPQGCSGGCV